MEKLKIKLIAIALIIMLSLAIIPMNVFAANENIQIVNSEKSFSSGIIGL